MRGKIKKTVVRVVDRAYGLHPDDSTFSSGSDAKALYAEKKRYISEKIESLLGRHSPYLRGPATEVILAQYSLIHFTN